MIGEDEIREGAALMEDVSPDGSEMAAGLGIDGEALQEFALEVCPPMTAHAAMQLASGDTMRVLLFAIASAYQAGFYTGVAAERVSL